MLQESNLDFNVLSANRNIAAKNYWNERLNDFGFATYFEGAGINTIGTRQTALYECDMPAAIGKSLKGIAGSDKASHIILLTAMAILARNCSSVEDVVIFSPLYTGSIQSNNENEWVPIRVNNFAGARFAGLVKTVKNNLVNDYRYGNYPINKMFTDEAGLKDLLLVALSVEEIHVKPSSPDIFPDLHFVFSVQGKLSLQVTYNARQFDAAFIAHLTELYCNLLGNLLTCKDRSIDDIDMIGDAEKEKIIDNFNNTAKDFPSDKTILDFFLEQVALHPEHIAVKIADGQLTYRELHERSNQVAAFLCSLAPGKGTVVAVQLDRSLDLIIAIYGILKAGCIYLPVTLHYPIERVKYILRNSNVNILFRDEPDAGLINEFACVSVNAAVTYPVADINLAKPSDYAYIIYTSGSTGNPKGVLIKHRSVVNRLHWMQNEYKLTEQDIILQKTPVVFDVSVWELFWWCFSGAKLVLAGPGAEKDPAELCRIVETESVTIVHFVPSMLNALLIYLKDDHHRHSFKSIKKLFTSGEALNANDALEYLDYYPHTEIHNLYGPTEATVDVSFFPVLPSAYRRNVPIGKPIDNTKLYIYNKHMQLQPVGIPGELYIGGVNLSPGYLNQVELTVERFIPDPLDNNAVLYKTGDSARWLDDGNIEFLGRIDNQVKIRGNRIEPGEIEHVIKSFPSVKNSIVLTKETGHAIGLVAYLVTDDSFVEQDLRNFIGANLPDYMIPSHFFLIDSIPTTVNGKVDRKKLLAIQHDAGAGFVAAASELENILDQYWKVILKNDRISVNDNFFRIGGDSILAVKLIGMINNELPVQLSVNDFYQHNTIKELALFIEGAKGEGKLLDYKRIENEVDAFGEWYKKEHPGELIEAVYPMSDIEKAMCYVHKSRPEDILYYEQIMQRVTYEKLDAQVLQKAVRLLVQKHEILRTGFDIDSFAHIVYKKVNSDMLFFDFSNCSETEQRQKIEAYREQSRQKHFDLNTAPLWRIVLFRLYENHHEILFEYHHAVLDGWSYVSLLTELNNVYGELLKDPHTVAHPLQVNFRDYIIQELVQKENAGTRNYWKKELQGYTRLQLGEVKGARKFKSVRETYPLEMLRNIEAVAEQLNTTVKNVMFAAYLYTMRVLSCNNDVLTGLVTFTRPLKKDGEKILGCFLNTIPFRIQIPDNITWAGFIKMVDKKLMELKQYEHLSLLEIKKSVGKPTHTENPLFDTFFNFINWHVMDDMKLEKMSDKAIDIEEFDTFLRGNTFFDVNYDVNKERIYCMHEYSSPFMTEELFARYNANYYSIVERISNNPNEIANQHEVYWKEEKEMASRLLQQYTLELMGSKRLAPASWYQERIWKENRVQDHLPLVMDMEGSLDIISLEKSIRETIKRHDVLRTVLVETREGLFQKINEHDRFVLPVINVKDKASDITELTEENVRQSFKLNRSLIRVLLFQTGQQQNRLVIVFHKLIIDRYSAFLLAEELYTGYLALLQGVHTQEKFTALQYAGFSCWQRECHSRLNRYLLHYWKNQVGHEANILELPADTPRSAAPAYTEARESVHIPKILLKKMAAFEKRNGINSRILLMAVFKILLGRYVGRNTVAIGTVAENRNEEHLADVVGPLDNIIVIKSVVNAGYSFEDYMLVLSEIYEAALKNQSLPFELLLRELAHSEPAATAPLFNIFFQYDDRKFHLVKTEGMEVSVFIPSTSNGAYDLGLYLQRADEEIHGQLIYNAALFNSGTISLFLAHYYELIKQLLANPRQKLVTVGVHTEKEKQQILRDFNNTHTAHGDDSNIIEVFTKQVLRTPGNIALKYGDITITYQQLNRASDRIAAYLRNTLHITSGDPVGLMLERDEWLVPFIFGILKAGGVYVPVYPRFPADRISYIISDAQLKYVIIRGEYPALAANSQTVFIHVNDIVSQLPDHTIDFTGTHLSANAPAYIIYTSGSSGRPKGVLVEHRSLLNIIQSQQHHFPVKEGDSFLLKTSCSFDVSLAEIFGWFFEGGSLVILEAGLEADPESIAATISRHQVTHINFVPSVFSAFVDALQVHADTRTGSIKYIFLAGEALPKELIKKYDMLNLPSKLLNLYGPTEAAVYSCGCILPPDNNDVKPSIGKPLNNVRIYIIDENGNLQPPGIPGELCIAGAGVARGYINNAAATAEKFISNPFDNEGFLYKTGDVARWLPDGNIDYLGRIDNQVKIRGFRIELSEIESWLATFDEVKENAVAVKEINGEKVLAAYYVAENHIAAEALRNYLLTKLPDYMVPATYVHLEKLPLSLNGKLDRKALPDPGIKQEYVAPVTKTESMLAGIWADVLNIEEPGTNINFFELGGHSLLAIGVTTAIRKQFNLEVSIGALFEFPTIAALAAHIQSQFTENAPEVAMYDIMHTSIAATISFNNHYYYPLSSAQRRIYFLYEFDRLSLAYNMPQAVKLQGRVDYARLQECFTSLIKRHESLRTGFEVVSEELYQRIWDEVAFNIEHYECAEGSEEEGIIKQFIRPFVLQQAPLMRIGLIRKGDQEHILLTDMHHIITDGISQGLLVRDFMLLYNKEALPELPVQYRDYVQWQHCGEQRERLRSQQAFWTNEFTPEVSMGELPFDYNRPLIRNHAGGSVFFSIGASETERLKQIAHDEGVTLFMVLLTVYNALLRKLLNEEDIVVGVPVGGRHHGDLQNIMGMFVNMLAIRNWVEGTLSFRELLAAVRLRTLLCLENQEYQYEDLVDELKVVRDTSRNTLFDVVFAYENYQDTELFIPDLRLVDYHRIHEVSKFDLTLNAREAAGEINLSFVYPVALFKKETIERYAAYFKKIVSEIAQDTDHPIGAIPMVDEQERQQLLQALDELAVGYPKDKTVMDLFCAQVQKRGDETALEYKSTRMSYKDLDQYSNRVAWALREAGVGRDTIVALLTDRGPETVIGMLGILKAGGAYLPIDIDYPDERIRYMLLDSATQILLKTNKSPVTSGFEGTVLNLNTLLQEGGIASMPPVINEPQDLCYIIYTSGTTGKPKGVLVEHRQVVRLLFNERFYFSFSETDVWTMFHSHCFDFSVWEMYGALLYGGKLIIIPKMISRDPARYLELLQQGGVTVLNQTPSAFYNLIDAEKQQQQEGSTSKPLQLRYVIFGGEALKPVKLRWWHQIHPNVQLINMFGITETTVHVTIKEIGQYEIDNNISNIGKPIATLSGYIFDKDQQLAVHGVKGELYVGGEGVARGYLNRGPLTSERFITHPATGATRLYRSGDLVKTLSSGELEYLGRIDSQVKIRGFRVELGEIESCLLRHEQIGDAVVLDRRDSSGNAWLCGYIVLKETITTTAIRNYLVSLLPEYMVPSQYVIVERIPQTPNGKVDKTILLELGAAPAATSSPALTHNNPTSPANSTEAVLLQIWSDVLKTPVPDRDSNFFNMGGNSMLAIKLVNRINKQLDVQMNIADLFIHPTITSFAACMHNRSPLTSEMQNRQAIREALEQQKHRFMQQYMLRDMEAIEDMYPASDIQRGMLFHSLKEAGIYHDQMVHVVQYAAIDEPLLQKALALMINKHAILRTAFFQEGENLYQFVYREIKAAVKYADLSSHEEKEQLQIIEEYLHNDKNTSFTHHRPGLWRFACFKIAGNKYCMVLSFHHAVIDGWSDASFNTELHNTIIGLQQNPAYTLHPLQSSYKDFIIEQLAVAADQNKQLFWKKELADYKRFAFTDTNDTNEFANSAASLPEALHDGLRQTAQRLHCSSKHISFSAFLYALKMFSYEDDLTVGLISNNRPLTEDADRILGCFLNTVPVRMQVASKITWKEWVNSVDDKLKMLKQYDHVSFAKIVSLLQEPYGTGNAITDIIYNYIDFQVYDEIKKDEGYLSVNNEQTRLVEQYLGNFTNVMDNYLFSFTVDETGSDFTYTLSYHTSFVSKTAAEKFMHYFRNILSLIVNETESSIDHRAIMEQPAVHQLLQAANGLSLAWPFDKTVVQLFEEQVQKTPGKTALVFNEQALTYNELNEQANRLAHYLQHQAAGPDTVVGVLIERSMEMIIGIIAVLKTGAAYLPLDTMQPVERTAAILRESRAVMLLTEAGETDLFKEYIPTVDVRAEALKKEPRVNLALPLQADSTAYIIYTSGSTGMPKGVVIRHRAVSNLICSRSAVFGIGAHDNILQFSAICFDASVEQIWLALLNGARLTLIRKDVLIDKALFNAYLANKEVTHLDTTPSFLENITITKPNSVQRIITGGETCPVRLAAKLYADYQLYNEYGPTEATIVTAACRITENEVRGKRIPLGRPVHNTSIYILDVNRELLPVGVKGEIYIGGEGLATGYLYDDVLTNEKFVVNPFDPDTRLYRTGDFGCWLDNGHLEFLGRVDDQIKISGFRIEPREIENRLATFPGIEDAVVVPVEKGDNTFLVAYYVAAGEIPAVELKTFLLARLPDYMVPSFYTPLASLPLTVNGKLDRKRLPAPAVGQSAFTAAASSRTAANQVEELLQEIWSEVLGILLPAIDSNLFSMGGNSIVAIKLVNTMNKRLGVQIDIAALLSHPTITSLAEHLITTGILSNDANAAPHNQCITLLKRQHDTVNNLFFIHDGSGDVRGYIELCDLIQQYNCRGLQCAALYGHGPVNTDIPELSRQYVTWIKSIQPQGPYRLAGWSLGGLLAYETALQLEAVGNTVDFLLTIDTQFTEPAGNRLSPLKDMFTYAQESAYLSTLLGNAAQQLTGHTIAELWQSATQLLKVNQTGIHEIVQMIPKHILALVPPFQKITIEELIGYVNTVRTLEMAMHNYRQHKKLNAPLTFIKAGENKVDTTPLSHYFNQEMIIKEVPGDHFTILQQPHVQTLWKAIETRLLSVIA